MSRSPFHGIFSFGASQSEAELEEAPAPALPKVKAVAKPTPATNRMGQIAVDIYEQDGYYVIRAPIAGVKMSDLDIEIDGNDITIKGTRKGEDSIAGNQFYLQECFWGQFSRRVSLPVAIDPKKIKATFSKDSILKILVPKEEKIKIVRISEGA